MLDCRLDIMSNGRPLSSTAYYTRHYTRSSCRTLCKWALCLLALLLVPAPCARGLRREDKKWFPDLDINSYPLLPSYAPEYYYSHLSIKLKESLSTSNCTIFGAGGLAQGYKAPQGQADLEVKVLSPPPDVMKKWGPDSHLQKTGAKIFTAVSGNLCKSKRWVQVGLKGVYKKKSGCLPVFRTEEDRKRIVKRVNDFGATLHPAHIRCDNLDLLQVCSGGSSAGLVKVQSRYRPIPRNQFPFVVLASNVVVARSGMLTLPCGPFGLLASCEAVNWGVPVAAGVASRDDKVLYQIPVREIVRTCRADQGGPQCQALVPVYERVFVMTQYDDTQIGQFIQEALPKLVFHLDFLLNNPDVKIHYGFTKQRVLPTRVLPHQFFETVGLGARLINGTVFAKKVILPREGGCQDVGYNAWENIHLRERFLALAGVREDHMFRSVKSTDRRSILILTRTPGKYTQNKAQTIKRMWPKAEFPLLVRTLQELFPSHEVEIFSDANHTLMTCPLCQARAFNRADLAVGFHGAGMTNAIFMRPGSTLVEVVYDYDSRHLPLIGIFPRVSGLVGLHHYIHYTKDTGVDGIKLATEAAAFHKRATLYSS